MIPQKIYEEKGILEYLISRQLLKQYQKECKYILSGWRGGSNFKQRKPIEDGLYYFRINKKYRAIGYFRDENFIVVEINDHQ